ncbi:MAG: ATP-binding protein [Candidatus Omnitrophota bacterium]|nr:ATP-binding protein [Candidatus Omnitrophota bacterium]
MSYFALSALINGIISTTLGIFVFTRNRKDIRYITHSLFSLTVAIWSYFYFGWQITTDKNLALIFCRGLMTGAIFIPVCYLHHLLTFFDIYNQKKRIIIYGYLGGLLFLILDFTPLFIKDVSPKLMFKFWPNPGIAFHPFLILWIWFVIYGLLIIINEYKNSRGFKKNQLKYVLLATFIGWSGGATSYPLWYNVPIVPFGNILVSGYMIILTYAILRYRLMDITVAITRTTVFIAVYTFVLGFPFALASWLKPWLIDYLGPNWWMAPLGLMALLATVGPFIYIYLDRKAEERLLREQRRYQDTLKQASAGMTRIRNLRRLLDLITHIVTKTVRIGYAAVYLHDRDTDEFILQVSRDKGRIPIPKLTPDNPLITWLITNREPLIYEEVKRQMSDSNNNTYKNLEESMRLLDASVVIPSFLEDKFMGFFVLGDKITGQIYTPDDLDVFRILASQAALAIENAQFYEEAKEMQEQIAQAEKMATIGTMADGLSHQINNRFYALSLIAGDTLDTIKITDTSACTPEVKEMLNQINHALDRIQTNVMQGGEVVKGILKYTRRGDASLEALTLDQVLDGTLEMVQYKVKLSEVDIIRDYPKDSPKIKGNLIQLQEVFFNFIDNAYDAIVERRDLLKEEGYRGRITVSTRPKDSVIEVTIEDNGMGVKEEDMKKMFTPFFTTKVSSRRGTGLGLYVINRILTDNHKGKISVESEYKLGTRFIVELPIAVS